MPDETPTEKPKKSMRTTVAGVLGSLLILGTNLMAVIDDDPATVLDAAKVIHELGLLSIAIGLVAARDHNVTSEQAGLVKP